MAALSTAPALDLTAASANRMLASLSPDGQERLLRDALAMLVHPGDVLYDPAETIPWVFFPLTCLVSILTVLARMLHARRASVAVALRELQDLDCVTTRRGGTTIVDRDRLRAEACECYEFIRAEYTRLIPGEPPPP